MDCHWRFTYDEKHMGEDPLPVFEKYFKNGLIKDDQQFFSILEKQREFQPMGEFIGEKHSGGKTFKVSKIN